jgi:hypothetical protein
MKTLEVRKTSFLFPFLEKAWPRIPFTLAFGIDIRTIEADSHPESRASLMIVKDSSSGGGVSEIHRAQDNFGHHEARICRGAGISSFLPLFMSA